MADTVLTDRDIHGIVKILQNNSDLILSKDVLCGGLGLTIGEREEIAIRVDRDRSGSYNYLSLVLNKWIGLNGDKATVNGLARILRQEHFNSTADELLKTLNIQNIRTENKTSFSEIVVKAVTKSNNVKPAQVPKISPNEIRPISEAEKEKPVPTPSTIYSEDSCATKNVNQIQPDRNVHPNPSQITEKPAEIKTTEVSKSDKIEPVPKSSAKEIQPSSSMKNDKPTQIESTETNEIKNTIPSLDEKSDKLWETDKMSVTRNISTDSIASFSRIVSKLDNFFNNDQPVQVFQVPKSSPNVTQPSSSTVNDKNMQSKSTEISNAIKNRYSTILKKYSFELSDKIPDEETSLKSSEMNEMANQFEQVKLDGSQQEQYSISKNVTIFCGYQTELNEFLELDPEKLTALKSIEFDRIEMSWREFWKSIQHIKTLESIKLTNLNLPHVPTPPQRLRLFPNLRKYVLSLDEKLSQQIVIEKQKQRKQKNLTERKYLVQALIPFAKNDSEEVWTTCSGIDHIELKLIISSNDVIFERNRDNFQFDVDRMYVEYYQKFNSTQRSLLPNFLQTFQGLKILRITNDCGLANALDFSSVPSSLAHLWLSDIPSSTRQKEIDVALKSFKDLISLTIGCPTFDVRIHRIDLAYLSPKIRCLVLDNVNITSSSASCEFKKLNSLVLTDIHFDSSVNVPFVFKHTKICYLRGKSGLSDPLYGLKKWLEMNTLETIAIEGLKIDKEAGEILSSYGVPSNADLFTLKKNVEGQWKFVSLSEEILWTML